MLLQPAIGLSFPMLCLVVRSELGVSQGQENIIESSSPLSQLDRSLQGRDRIVMFTESITSCPQGVPVSSSSGSTLGNLVGQNECQLRVSPLRNLTH